MKMLNIKPSLNPIPQSLYILLSKTLPPCHSPPRPTCSRTCCLSDLPSPPLPICSSHAGLWALLQPGQARSCLGAFAFVLPSWKAYFSNTYMFHSLLLHVSAQRSLDERPSTNNSNLPHHSYPPDPALYSYRAFLTTCLVYLITVCPSGVGACEAGLGPLPDASPMPGW